MLDREKERQGLFTRRAVIIGALQGTFLTVLGARLAWLQIAEGSRYTTMAEDNRINVKLLAPSRGIIVDRNGLPMAVNTQNFIVQVIPEQTKDLERALRELKKLISLTDEDISRVIAQSKKIPKFFPIQIRDNLTWDEVSTVEVNLPDLPGLSINVGEVRYYPMGPSTAHILGYVGAVSKGDLDESDPLLKIPGFKIGKTGIERTYDGNLRGRAGAAEVEVNVVGREVRELSRTPGDSGQPLILSLDSELQKYTQERLSETRSASAIIMDVHTGAVYALASAPSFDPNIFARGLKAEQWEDLLSRPEHPLNNKAVSGLYPPGSTFKMIAALAALELGIINRNTSFYCPGHYNLGNAKFHCWKPGGHGYVNVVKAITESCDTFFYNIAMDIGIDRLAEYSKKFGLGQTLDIGLPEEKAGLIPTREWKKSNIGVSWQPGESVVAVIGQGYTQATALQLATMTSRLVNGGKEVKPWLVEYVGNSQMHKDSWPKINIKKQNLDIVIQGMINVVNGQGGTAGGSRITEPGMEMGGKTGTSQVKRITADERARGVRNEDLPWHLRHHALFVGFAPVHEPRYACAVIVEHGVGGSRAAAPVAKDLLIMAQQRDPASRASVVPESPPAGDKKPAHKAPQQG